MEEKDTVLRFGKEVLLAESKALAAVSQALDDNFNRLDVFFNGFRFKP